jgi:PPOX class probable F420-dependent enzyme
VTALTELARNLLDGRTFAVVSTINPDGAPQSSVIWIKRDGDQVLFSTILGRRKTRNMQRDPRINVAMYDPADPYRYVEIRGTVTLTEEGGPELIQELSRKYDDEPFVEGHPDNVRVVVRVTPTKVVDR